MHIHTIAIKNIIRRKSRMALVIIGLAVGVATLAAIVTAMLSFQANIDKKLDTFGFNIVVYPSSSNLSLSYGGMTVSGVDTYGVRPLTVDDIKKIKRIPSAGKIAAVSPKLLQVAEIKGNRALIVGTDFSRELLIKKWWHIVGKNPAGPNEVIAGADAAKNLGLKIGDGVRFSGKTFKVAAILKGTGSQDDGLIFADLKQVQDLFGQKGNLSLIEISAKSSGDIDSVVKDLEKTLPETSVSSIKQAVKYKERAVGSVARFGLAVSVIIIVISGLVVFTTMTSSVSDRRREIGIFRAIGYRQSTVARVIFTEAFILSTVGGTLGYIIGFALIYVLPILIKKVELTVSINFSVLALSIGLAIVIGVTASLIPARRAANMDPADALKTL